MAKFAIWTDFRVGNDELGRSIDKYKIGVSSLGRSLSRTGAILKGVLGGNILYAGMNRARMEVAEMVTQYRDFDHMTTAAAARFGDTYDKGTEGYRQLEEAARRVGANTEHFSATAAGGLNYMAMAGFSASESISMLGDIANFSTAATLDFATSADYASDALGAFGKNTGTAEQKAANFRDIMDQAAKATNTANFDLNMWFESIRESAPSWSNANQKMSTLNSTLGILANSGKKGATSGYMLRNVMNKLANPTGRAAKLMKKYKIEVADSKGNFLDFADILASVEKGFTGVSQVQRASAIETIFGQRAVAGMNILLAEGSNSLRQYAMDIENSSGSAEKLANKMRGSLQNRIAKIKSGITELGFAFFESFGPDIESGIKNVSAWLKKANEPGSETKKTIKEIGSALSKTINFIVENRETIFSLARAYIGLKVAMGIGSAVDGVVGGLSSIVSIISGGGGAASVVGKLGGAFGGGAGATTAGGLAGGVTRATASVGGFKGALAAAGPVLASFVGGLTLGYEIWRKIERAQKEQTKRENKSIRGYYEAGKLTGSEAQKRAIGLEEEFLKYSKMPGGGMFKDLLSGKMGENNLKKSFAGETLLKAEEYYALKRRMGETSNKAGWVTKGGWRDEGYSSYGDWKKAKKEEAYKTSHSIMNFSPSDTPWSSFEQPQTKQSGVSDISEMYFNAGTSMNKPSTTVEKKEVIHTFKFDIPENVKVEESVSEPGHELLGEMQ